MSSKPRLQSAPSPDTREEAVSLQFTEEMHGFFCTRDDGLPDFGSQQAAVFRAASENGQDKNRSLRFHLTIRVDDIDAFCNDPRLTAAATGYIECPALGGRLHVDEGIFNLFVNPDNSPDLATAKEMHYTLYFRDANQNPYTFYGYKTVKKEQGLDVWEQTTTLYTRIWEGHQSHLQDQSKLFGQGVLRLNAADFAHQMTTFKSNGGDFFQRTRALQKFMEIFADNLWDAYAPAIFDTDSERWNDHIYPVFTTRGVRDCEVQNLAFDTEDGLTLQMQRFRRRETKDVVLLLHGLTNSTDMFIMPEHTNLVEYLLDHEYTDVWSLDWRGSQRLPYNMNPHRYSMDYVTQFDIPAAIQKLRQTAGTDVRIHVIAHCVGSISFMSSLSTGLVDGITSVISNSVSLTPKVHLAARLKILFAPNLVEYVLRWPYVSPKIAYMPGPGFGKWLPWLQSLYHRECREPACHMVSFMWGWGFPAAYEHDNLSPLTHRRLVDLFGATAMHYYRHIHRQLAKKQAVPYDRKGLFAELPESYLDAACKADLPPILFVAGSNNNIFLNSNEVTYKHLKDNNPKARVEFRLFQGYGHQDVFIGKTCDRDIFPHFITFLNKHRG